MNIAVLFEIGIIFFDELKEGVKIQLKQVYIFINLYFNVLLFAETRFFGLFKKNTYCEQYFKRIECCIRRLDE